MTPITKTAAAAIPRIQRRRLGDGMVRPVRALEIKDPYTGWFRLIPGRDQVSMDWWGYRRNPELFMPVNRDDTRTVARHRQALERARHQLEREMAGTTRATTSSGPKRFQLPDRQRGRFRLP
jgi:hypothetical protein